MCNGIATEGQRIEHKNGSVFFICPVCHRKNRFVYQISKDGIEFGHLSPVGPKSRNMIKFEIRVPQKLYNKIRKYDHGSIIRRT